MSEMSPNNDWDDDSHDYSITSIESSHDIPKLEKDLYYFGLRGNQHLGPKLVFRTSNDVFTPPVGPENIPRIMQVLEVNTHHKLSEDNLWKKIRGETVRLLDDRKIEFTSIDLARFRWGKQITHGYGGAFNTSRVTIWVGVLPDSTTSDVAFKSSQDILNLLKKHDIHDIDVAYRESLVHFLTGPKLLASVSDLHPLKDVIDWVTTVISLSIASVEMPDRQGTLGFYFQAGNGLYGVTARHVLFSEDEGNNLYSYTTGPKKEVILMGLRAFKDFQDSIQDRIDILKGTVTVLKTRVAMYKKRVDAGNVQANTDLVITEADVDNKSNAIDALEAFSVTIREKWTSMVDDRIIGHVIWAPPISWNTPPHGYTADVCVIKLDQDKFRPNFIGNVMDLGTEIEPGNFMNLMNPRGGTASEFSYPEDRLFKLGGILSADQIQHLNDKDPEGDLVRYVIKRAHIKSPNIGHAKSTTIGRLSSRFESIVRHYGTLGTFDSVEATVYPYNSTSGPFSRGGDSGALVVGHEAEFVALLTGGTGPTSPSDITYCTPMHWLWNDIIKPMFPGAKLDCS